MHMSGFVKLMIIISYFNELIVILTNKFGMVANVWVKNGFANFIKTCHSNHLHLSHLQKLVSWSNKVPLSD